MNRRAGRFAVGAGAAALLGISLVLFQASRGKWSEDIVDSGREWIVPDALARGELLYRDIVYWFGPFTPYLHAGFFRVFGSNFVTLVFAGVAGSLAVLGALNFALRRVTGKAEAALWSALAVPTLLFMPSAGGSILGMGYRIWHAAAFTLLAVALAAGGRGRWMIRALGAGALCGLAGLCRTEWGLAALAGIVAAGAVRSRFRLAFLREALAAALAFCALLVSVLGAFSLAAGWDAVIRDGHVLLTGIPEETRRFLRNNSNTHDVPGGLLRLLHSGAMWFALFVVVQIAARPEKAGDSLKRRLPWLAGALLFLIIYSEYGWSDIPNTRMMLFFSAAPLLGLGALVSGLCRGGGVRAAGLAGFGLLGLVLSYRKPFSIGDAQYVAPPLLFAFVSAAGLLRGTVLKERARSDRACLRRAFGLALVLLIALSFLTRVIQYANDDRVALPGTAGMLSTTPERARSIDLLAKAVRRLTPSDGGLVVIPEGEVINFLSGRPNPIRYRMYIPGYLSEENESAVIVEFERVKPSAIVILDRQTAEYGRRFFGDDYGRLLKRWIEENYIAHRFEEAEQAVLGGWARLYMRRP